MATTGLRELAEQFDTFFVDVWGVLHDGAKLFPPVLEALTELKAAKRCVVLVTNTSRLNPPVVETLESLGISRALFHEVVTAGDVTREALHTRDPSLFGLLPSAPRCFHWGNAEFVPWLFELGFDFTDDVANADLVIATGAVPDETALASVMLTLAPAAERRAPLVCTNPDRVIPTAAGMRLGPGAIAKAYADLGARIFLYGKPHLPIYVAARRSAGASTRILALGDTLETDIRGALNAGVSSAFVRDTGVHAASRDSRALFEEAGVTPDFVLPAFAW